MIRLQCTAAAPCEECADDGCECVYSAHLRLVPRTIASIFARQAPRGDVPHAPIPPSSSFTGAPSVDAPALNLPPRDVDRATVVDPQAQVAFDGGSSDGTTLASGELRGVGVGVDATTVQVPHTFFDPSPFARDARYGERPSSALGVSFHPPNASTAATFDPRHAGSSPLASADQIGDEYRVDILACSSGAVLGGNAHAPRSHPRTVGSTPGPSSHVPSTTVPTDPRVSLTGTFGAAPAGRHSPVFPVVLLQARCDRCVAKKRKVSRPDGSRVRPS